MYLFRDTPTRPTRKNMKEKLRRPRPHLMMGVNDLETLHPDIAAQWDQDRNTRLTPATVLATARAHVWWVCPYGHSWKAAVCTRTVRRKGCPTCESPTCISGVNDLETLHPDIARMYATDMNAMPPSKVASASHHTYWFRCKRGHLFSTQARRMVAGYQCVQCSATYQPHWFLSALCAQTDPDVFYPERAGTTAPALSICSRCPVIAECRAYGDRVEKGLTQYELWGVLGGETAYQRAVRRRNQAA